MRTGAGFVRYLDEIQASILQQPGTMVAILASSLSEPGSFPDGRGRLFVDLLILVGVAIAIGVPDLGRSLMPLDALRAHSNRSEATRPDGSFSSLCSRCSSILVASWPALCIWRLRDPPITEGGFQHRPTWVFGRTDCAREVAAADILASDGDREQVNGNYVVACEMGRLTLEE